MATRYQHGRRYHGYADASYLLPNDESTILQEELRRLDLQHEQWKLTLDGSLYFAPLPNPFSKDFRVLDIGCGTGIWAIEFAHQHPQSQVLGLDLVEVQPDRVPANCKFTIANIEHDWNVDGLFDYVHSRFLIMGIKNWSSVFQKSFKYLKPGGWVEYQEANVVFPAVPESPKPNPEMTSLVEDITKIADNMGTDIVQASRWAQAIKDAGFVNHSMTKVRWPLGEWSTDGKEKTVGKMHGLNMKNVLEGVSLAYLVNEEIGNEVEVRRRIERVKAEIDDKDVWMYQELYIHCAQKPA